MISIQVRTWVQFNTLLYCIVLCCVGLYCIVLYRFVTLYCIVLCCIVTLLYCISVSVSVFVLASYWIPIAFHWISRESNWIPATVLRKSYRVLVESDWILLNSYWVLAVRLYWHDFHSAQLHSSVFNWILCCIVL